MNKTFICHFPIRPQSEGRAAVGSSAVVMGHASQENTDVTVWQTAQMAPMSETAVSLLRGTFPFFSISGSCGILINLLRLRGSLTDRMGHNMLLVVRGWLQIPWWISQAEVQLLCYYCADMVNSRHYTLWQSHNGIKKAVASAVVMVWR